MDNILRRVGNANRDKVTSGRIVEMCGEMRGTGNVPAGIPDAPKGRPFVQRTKDRCFPVRQLVRHVGGATYSRASPFGVVLSREMGRYEFDIHLYPQNSTLGLERSSEMQTTMLDGS